MWRTAFIYFRTSFIKIFYSFFTFQQTRLYNIIDRTTTLYLTLKMTSAQVVETSVTDNSSFQNYTNLDDHTIRITLSCYIGENCSKIGCAITANSQGTLTWFSARATATVLTSKTFLCSFVLFFSFFRFSGVVRNYQAKLIRDFLPLGVMQKQMKSTLVDLSFTWTIT